MQICQPCVTRIKRTFRSSFTKIYTHLKITPIGKMFKPNENEKKNQNLFNNTVINSKPHSFFKSLSKNKKIWRK